MTNRSTGRNSVGLADILNAPNGPSERQVDDWVRHGYLRPALSQRESRAERSWTDTEVRVAIDMGRLVRAGLKPPVAELVARHPNGGPVILGPGIVISLFAAQATLGEAIAS